MRSVAEVETSRDGAVLTITLNRPDVLNAFNTAMHRALGAALAEARDPGVRAVVITGAGRGFCVGQDLNEFRAAAGDIGERLRSTYHPNVLAIRALEKPVIAAVNGPAAGAGISFACACDIRIASDNATFVPAFVNIGLVPDSGATFFVTRLVGYAGAFEWLSSGRRLTAAEAHAWGLVSEVVEAEALAARAAELAAQLAALPTRAIGETKRLLDAAHTTPLPEQLELEAWAQAELVRTHDFTEGVAAFNEKREPRFTGAPLDRLHPVQLVVRDDLRRWRLTVLLRLLLAIPHLAVVYAWQYLAFVVAVVNWVITLVRGRTPAGVHAWLARFLRYQTHVSAYTLLIADPYPGFRGWFGTYPVDLDVAPPEPQRRLVTLFRIVLVLPAYALTAVLATVVQVIAVVGWFVCLALGRMPKGMRDLSAYCLRYQAQTLAYLYLLTDRYPSLASGSGFQFEEA
jgi:2-(1,2-epoxy-1,2-dihydrophenyl)acetyl-CoA isomerase